MVMVFGAVRNLKSKLQSFFSNSNMPQRKPIHPAMTLLTEKIEANKSLVLSMFENNLKAEECMDRAEDYFKRGDVVMAIVSIGVALTKEPQHRDSRKYIHTYLTHLTHMMGSKKKMINWYEILSLPYRQYKFITFNDIDYFYKWKTLALHPDNCSSAAAEGAIELIRAAWEVLSDPVKRREFDDQLMSAEQF